MKRFTLDPPEPLVVWSASLLCLPVVYFRKIWAVFDQFFDLVLIVPVPKANDRFGGFVIKAQVALEESIVPKSGFVLWGLTESHRKKENVQFYRVSLGSWSKIGNNSFAENPLVDDWHDPSGWIWNRLFVFVWIQHDLQVKYACVLRAVVIRKIDCPSECIP